MNTSYPILSQFLDTCTFSFKYRSSLFSEFKKSRLHQSFADKFQTIFMRANVFETDLYDHHKNDLYYHETWYYRDYLKFNINYFSSELSRQLDSIFCSIKENIESEELYEISRFHSVFLNLLNIQASLKKKFLRSNNSPFMTKTLKKAKDQKLDQKLVWDNEIF